MILNGNTIICAAFCGVGKTFICEKTTINAVEVEYWKYKENRLYEKYIEDIKNYIGNWHIWLNELKEQKYCRHIVLESGQYLQDVLLK